MLDITALGKYFHFYIKQLVNINNVMFLQHYQCSANKALGFLESSDQHVEKIF